MITLIISEKDGSLYWQDYFNDIDLCNKWIENEQSMPYWKDGRTWEIVLPPPPDIAKEQEIAAMDEQRAIAVAEIKESSSQDIKSFEDLVEIVMKLRKIILGA